MPFGWRMVCVIVAYAVKGTPEGIFITEKKQRTTLPDRIYDLNALCFSLPPAPVVLCVDRDIGVRRHFNPHLIKIYLPNLLPVYSHLFY